jgi:uncharacterized protein (TIGR03435 family)
MLVVAQMVIAAVTAFGQGNAALPAQPRGAAQQPAAAAGKLVEGRLEFEVASVRQNKSNDDGSMNVDPTLTDGPVSTGGLYLARNIKLIQFIAFAYRLTQIQLASVVSQAPWVADDRFDIEARAAGDPGKAQYRLMMQSLLADRFKLSVHFETREMPVFALIPLIPGEPAAKLQPRPDGVPCPAHWVDFPEGIPDTCGIFGGGPGDGRASIGGRGVTMAEIANALTQQGSQIERPILDQTGLTGKYDFVIVFTPPISAEYVRRIGGPTLEDALRDQLGLKMEATTGPVDVLVVDRIEKPTLN